MIPVDPPILLPPVANFTADSYSGASPLTVQFTDTSTDTPTVWDWDFGDGSGHGSTQNPSHEFTGDGVYHVTLTVTKDIFTSSCTKSIVVSSAALPPIITDFTFDPATGFAPLTVVFASTVSGSPAYFWDFGDGTTCTLQNPTHTFESMGVFNVRLTVTNAYGSTYVEVTIVVLGWIDFDNGLVGYYIVDTLNDRVLTYATSGVFLASFGSHGTLNGKFIRPTQLSVLGGIQEIDRSLLQ